MASLIGVMSSFFFFFSFQHKGFCKATRHQPLRGEGQVDVDCEIFEPEVRLTNMSYLYCSDTFQSHKAYVMNTVI